MRLKKTALIKTKHQGRCNTCTRRAAWLNGNPADGERELQSIVVANTRVQALLKKYLELAEIHPVSVL